MTARIIAAKLLLKLIQDGQSFSDIKAATTSLSIKDRALTQELCFGVARWYFRLTYLVDQLLSKPLKAKDLDIYVLMLLGSYQILFTRIPDHAAISETVAIARQFHKEWATKLINAVLRNLIRRKDELIAKIPIQPSALYAHPDWMIARFKAWPSFEDIIQANNSPPPLCLRVNQLQISRESYLELLHDKGVASEVIPYTESGIVLKTACSPSEIPLFDKGVVSIQDGAAQLAAQLLDAKENDAILDACAAPGGKTCHILERQPKLKKLIALDSDAKRLAKVANNLERLRLQATLICHDVTDLSWWDGQQFNRILLDVPCSALGVVRRHPDIKLLRKATDIPILASIQYLALDAVWKTLKPGGELLYVTCSILAEENERVIQDFLRDHPDCEEDIIKENWGQQVSVGRQILPGMHPGMDGFYFAKLRRIG